MQDDDDGVPAAKSDRENLQRILAAVRLVPRFRRGLGLSTGELETLEEGVHSMYTLLKPVAAHACPGPGLMSEASIGAVQFCQELAGGLPDGELSSRDLDQCRALLLNIRRGAATSHSVLSLLAEATMPALSALAHLDEMGE